MGEESKTQPLAKTVHGVLGMVGTLAWTGRVEKDASQGLGKSVCLTWARVLWVKRMKVIGWPKGDL